MLLALIIAYLLPPEERVTSFAFAGRVLVYGLLIFWGVKFIATPMETNYEGGHLIFSPFGRFMMVLGGSLGQLLMPLICLGAFLFYNNDAFGATVALWWFAESLMDLSPYINDARDLQLILLGGVTGQEVEGHDWEYLLANLGWSQYDHTLAHAAYSIGIYFMVLAFLWGALLLYRQYQNLDRA